MVSPSESGASGNLRRMSAPRHELQQLLNQLEDQLPAMIRANPDPADFWPEFAGQADVMADAAGPADCDWVQDCLDAMLRHHGAPETA